MYRYRYRYEHSVQMLSGLLNLVIPRELLDLWCRALLTQFCTAAEDHRPRTSDTADSY
eukprot:SAG31_NODE_1443_length_8321_cov_6.313306_2_plen_58_part_00